MMNFATYSKELIRTETRNGNFPDQRTFQLHRKLAAHFIVIMAPGDPKNFHPGNGYFTGDKERLAKVKRATIQAFKLAFNNSGEHCSNVLTGESFYMGWCGTGPEAVKQAIEADVDGLEVRRPTWSEFLSWFMLQRWLEHFDGGVHDPRYLEQDEFNREFPKVLGAL